MNERGDAMNKIQITDCKTVELQEGAVVKCELKNTMQRVYAQASIMNIVDCDVLINSKSDFNDDDYITLPSGAAKNDKRFLNSAVLYMKAIGGAGKVTIAID
jgi:uncharacterized protein (AIM24 family)